MISKYIEEGKTLYEVKVFVKDRNRKQISRFKKGVTSEREAKRIEFELKQELLLEVRRLSEWTFGTWHEEVLRKLTLVLMPSTVMQYNGLLKKWLPKEWKNKLLSEIKDEDVHAVVFGEMSKENSSSTQKTILKLLRRVFEIAVEDGHLDRNPAHGLRVIAKPKEQRVLSAPEAQVLLTEARNCGHEHYRLWAFALMSGMRSGEMYALRWTDIDLDTGTIQVRKQWTSKSGLTTPKNNKPRVVPISKEFKTFLAELKLETPGFTRTIFDRTVGVKVTHDDYVLPTLSDWTLGQQAPVLKEFCGKIGITPVKFHDLRATFITNLLTNGVPLVQVMSIVGHSKMSTTDVYLRLAGVNVKGATEHLGYSPPAKKSEGSVLSFKPKSGV